MAWGREIDKNTESFLNLCKSLTSEQLNWKSDQNTWSVAQNLDHLIIINESYYPLFRQLKEGTYKIPFLGRFKPVVEWLGNTILQSVVPENTKKSRTFSFWEPQKADLSEDILERFVIHQSQLKKQIESLQHLDKDTIISSPANRQVVYTLGHAFELIVTHEKRHLQQIKGILKRLPSFI